MDGLAPAQTAPTSGPQLDNRRVLAALIDIALLIPVALLMSALFGGFTSAAAALTLGWVLYYYFALESDHGQTLGKRLMKIRVARADGTPLDSGRVAVRTLLRPIDAIGCYLLGLVVMLATGQRRQRLGDLAAGTVVTEAGSSAAAERGQAMPAPDATLVAPEISPLESPPADPLPPLREKPAADTGLRPDQVPPLRAFDPFAAPPAEEAVEPEPEPVEPEPAEPQPAEPESAGREPAEPEPPASQPERLEIVSSPIELIMGEQHETADDETEPRQAQDPPAAQA
jgi:uncharacterized RDD family membrane protein YckC